MLSRTFATACGMPWGDEHISQAPPLVEGFSSYAIMLLFRAIHSYADLVILMISYDFL